LEENKLEVFVIPSQLNRKEEIKERKEATEHGLINWRS
jgi:hypothetical protein